MEVAWECRGQIGWEVWAGKPEERRIEWRHIAGYVKEHWNSIYDACVAAEKKMIPGGTEILIMGDCNG